MSLIPFILNPSGAGPPTPTGVQLLPNDFSSQGSGTLYSGVKFGADGGVSERQPGGTWSRVYTWLLSGTNSTFYIVRTVVDGTLTTDAGAGPLVLSSDRIYDLQKNREDSVIVSFEIQIADTTVKSLQTYTFEVLPLL
jgi:hypothetical protein